MILSTWQDGLSESRVALVAGATRGAGRAIAVELARAGFFVYATGRSSRHAGPSEIGRPETIEETGELIGATGGAGSALVVDHEDPAAVAELVAVIERGRGRLDVLVNDIFGGDRYTERDQPLWEHDWAGGLRMLQMGFHTHVTEENWRDAVERRPEFAISEPPTYVARGVAALARAGDAERWAGTIASARRLADAYGFTDTDGSKPDCWGHLAKYGWGHAGGRGIEEFR
jgi:short chain dehydrogenase